MQKFCARQVKSNDNEGGAKKEGYVVLEPLAHSLLGSNTAVNMVPYLAGITINVANANNS